MFDCGVSTSNCKIENSQFDNFLSNLWGNDNNYDFFSYYKSRVFMLLVLIQIIIYFLFYKTIRFKDNIFLYTASILYIISITISSAKAFNTQVAFWGFPDRYEGFFVLICYIIIMLMTYNIVNSYNSINLIIKSLYFSSVIIAIIGFFQFLNIDFFRSKFANIIINPPQYSQIQEDIKFNLGERAVYATLYNTNYMGSLMGILIPLTLVWAIFCKNRVSKFFFSISAILFMFVLIVSHSRAGILGVFISIILLIIFLRNYIIKHYKEIFVILAASFLLIFLANKTWNNYLFYKIGSIFKDVKILVL